jgi:hypothetical protein
MLHAPALPGFVSEYLRLYAFAVAVAVVVAISLFIRRLPGWFRSVRAASWPIAQGMIETVSVKTVSGQALGELAYSYVANGERYSGYFLLQFADEQDAWEAIDPLKGQTIFVRYHSGNAAFSAVRRTDQSFQFAQSRESFLKRLIIRQILEALGADLGKWTRLASWNWPIVKGRVEHGAIGGRGDSENWWLALCFTAEVSYSYSVAGEYYSGRLERSFFRESSAEEFVNSLKERGVFVRYNQSSPSMSVLRNKDQQMSQPTQYQPVPGA